MRDKTIIIMYSNIFSSQFKRASSEIELTIYKENWHFFIIFEHRSKQNDTLGYIFELKNVFEDKLKRTSIIGNIIELS